MLPFYSLPVIEDKIRETQGKIEVKGGAGVCGKQREMIYRMKETLDSVSTRPR
jgi:hypothetical protein